MNNTPPTFARPEFLSPRPDPSRPATAPSRFDAAARAAGAAELADVRARKSALLDPLGWLFGPRDRLLACVDELAGPQAAEALLLLRDAPPGSAGRPSVTARQPAEADRSVPAELFEEFASAALTEPGLLGILAAVRERLRAFIDLGGVPLESRVGPDVAAAAVTLLALLDRRLESSASDAALT